MSNNEEQQKEQEEKGKIGKAFADNILKLEAILGGKTKLYGGKKLQAGSLEGLVTTLFKEENEALEAEIKAGLKGLIQAHQNFLKLVKDEEKKLDKLKEDKQKEFNTTASQLFAKLDDLPAVMKGYAESLRQAASGTPTPE